MADEKAAWPDLLEGALAETHQSIGVWLAVRGCEIPWHPRVSRAAVLKRFLCLNQGRGETEGNKLHGNHVQQGMAWL